MKAMKVNERRAELHEKHEQERMRALTQGREPVKVQRKRWERQQRELIAQMTPDEKRFCIVELLRDTIRSDGHSRSWFKMEREKPKTGKWMVWMSCAWRPSHWSLDAETVLKWMGFSWKKLGL